MPNKTKGFNNFNLCYIKSRQKDCRILIKDITKALRHFEFKGKEV